MHFEIPYATQNLTQHLSTLLSTAVANMFANAWSPRSTATSAADLGSSDLEFNPFSQATDRPIPVHDASEYILRRIECFKEGFACQQPRSH
jgi:hypothetical protein